MQVSAVINSFHPRFWKPLLRHRSLNFFWMAKSLPQGCTSHNSAQCCHIVKRSFSLLGLSVFPPGEEPEEGWEFLSQSSAFRIIVNVEREVVGQLFARCLCKKLWRRVLKWFLNTGIRVCTKKNHGRAILAVWTVTSHSLVHFWCISLERKGTGKINKSFSNRGLAHMCTCTHGHKKAKPN